MDRLGYFVNLDTVDWWFKNWLIDWLKTACLCLVDDIWGGYLGPIWGWSEPIIFFNCPVVCESSRYNVEATDWIGVSPTSNRRLQTYLMFTFWNPVVWKEQCWNTEQKSVWSCVLTELSSVCVLTFVTLKKKNDVCCYVWGCQHFRNRLGFENSRVCATP